MPSDKKFKRAVRARMDKTGESYTTARAVLETPRPPRGTIVHVPGVYVDVKWAATLRAIVAPPEAALPEIRRVCTRLAAQLEATAVLCFDARCTELFVSASDADVVELVRERLRPTDDASLLLAIDYLGPLRSSWQQLFYLRRIDFVAQLVVVFPRSQDGAELVRLRVGHAALAIERALAAAGHRPIPRR